MPLNLPKKSNDEAIINYATDIALATVGVHSLAARGIRVERSKEGISLNVNIVVNYGVKIPEVAWNVQENIKKSIAGITDVNIEKINIIIQGVE